MVQLEKLIQEGLQDTVEDLNNTRGQTVDSLQLCNNFVCNVIVSLVSYMLLGNRNGILPLCDGLTTPDISIELSFKWNF